MGSISQNKAAYLDKPASLLVVRDAPFPKAGPGEIVVRNTTVAINPVDWYMTDSGILAIEPSVKSAIIEVEDVLTNPSPNSNSITLWTGRSQDGAFQLYTILSVDKAAQLPPSIPYNDGVVLPMAPEAVMNALFSDRRNALPDFLPCVFTPALALPSPLLEKAVKPSAGKTIVVYGGSSSVGSATTQLAATSGSHVISIIGAKNFELAKASGAADCIDRKDLALVSRVVEAVRKAGGEFVGLVDAISISDTIKVNLTILEQLDGGHLALTHPHMGEDVVPDNVEIGMILSGGANETTDPMWRAFVGADLKRGTLKCLPPATVVGKGLEHVQKALDLSREGLVSGKKLVIELE
ncbi:hypothetical protein E8E11_004954 [Didymella keratinophila]|nr:hypothetical protein E8E11_004954 [Didymella keratinophila]